MLIVIFDKHTQGLQRLEPSFEKPNGMFRANANLQKMREKADGMP